VNLENVALILPQTSQPNDTGEEKYQTEGEEQLGKWLLSG